MFEKVTVVADQNLKRKKNERILIGRKSKQYLIQLVKIPVSTCDLYCKLRFKLYGEGKGASFM